MERGPNGKLLKSAVLDWALAAVERATLDLDSPGLCLACGEEQDGCEPDARRYECEACGEHKVYGAQELLLTLA